MKHHKSRYIWGICAVVLIVLISSSIFISKNYPNILIVVLESTTDYIHPRDKIHWNILTEWIGSEKLCIIFSKSNELPDQFVSVKLVDGDKIYSFNQGDTILELFYSQYDWITRCIDNVSFDVTQMGEVEIFITTSTGDLMYSSLHLPVP